LYGVFNSWNGAVLTKKEESTWGFDEKHPGWGKPLHQLMVKTPKIQNPPLKGAGGMSNDKR